MRTITVTVKEAADWTLIGIGRRGEDNATEVVFDISALQDKFGSGTVLLMVRRHSDTNAYPAVITQEGQLVHWVITSVETAKVGVGYCELWYYVDDVLAKTIVYKIRVVNDLVNIEAETPDPYETWLDRIAEQGAGATAAAASAAAAAAAAAAAKAAAEAAKNAAIRAMNAASGSAAEAAEYVPKIFGVCTDTGGTRDEWNVIIAGFNLYEGEVIHVLFENAGTIGSTGTSLNINDTGEIPVVIRNLITGQGSSGLAWNAGEIVSFAYDGESWVAITRTKNVYYGSCDTAEGTAAKAVTSKGFPDTGPFEGMILFVHFENTNTASGATLAVNGGTAKTIAVTATTTGVEISREGLPAEKGLSWEAGGTAAFVYTQESWVLCGYKALVQADSEDADPDNSRAGLMSVSDKRKLDSIDSDAQEQIDALETDMGELQDDMDDLQDDMGDLQGSMANTLRDAIEVTLPNVSDTNRSFAVLGITANHKLVQDGYAYLSNPSAAGGELTLTTGAGTIVVGGTLSGSTNIVATFCIKEQTATGTAAT